MPGSGLPLQFGAPAGLLALVALPIVLWLHLRRRSAPSEVVPSLVPWMTLLAERPSARRQIPASVLLAMHLTVAALIALALGEPSLRADATVGDDSVVVLDTSTSMRAANRWSEATDHVSHIASATSGRLSLVAAGPQPRVLVWRAHDRASADRALSDLRPGGTGADLPGAIALAKAVAGSGAAVHVVTDVERGSPDPDPGSVEWTTIGRAMDNVAITHAEARRLAGETRLFVRVANFADEPTSVELSLALDGRPHDGKTVALDAAGTTDTIWRIAEAADIAELRLSPGDDQPHDDFAVVPLDAARINVQLVGRSETVERALLTNPSFDTVLAGQGSLGTGAAVDVTVLTGSLPDTPPVGGMVLFAPTEGTIASPRSGPETATLDAASGHAITWGLDLHGARLGGVSDPDTPDWADVVMSADGRTVAYAGARGASRVVVFAFDPDEGDIASRLAFPLLVDRAVAWAANRAPASTVTAGSAVDMPSAPLSIQAPGNRTTFEWGSMEDTAEPGLYRAYAESDIGEPFAVFGVLAGDPDESDLRGEAGGDREGPAMPQLRAPNVPLWCWLAGMAVLICFAEGAWRAWAAGYRFSVRRS